MQPDRKTDGQCGLASVNYTYIVQVHFIGSGMIIHQSNDLDEYD